MPGRGSRFIEQNHPQVTHCRCNVICVTTTGDLSPVYRRYPTPDCPLHGERLKRVPLRLGADGPVIGLAEVNEFTSKIVARVTDPVAAAKLASHLTEDAGTFSISPVEESS